jgi:hypothetical protein
MTKAVSIFDDAAQFSMHLKTLREERNRRRSEIRAAGLKRRQLRSHERQAVLSKTDGLCHICGGKIDGAWAADHVLAHANGGEHSVGNYLPAHELCNNYRWFYGTEEFQWILKLGVWLRTRIEKKDRGTIELVEDFVRYEIRRNARRRRAKTSDLLLDKPPERTRSRQWTCKR